MKERFQSGSRLLNTADVDQKNELVTARVRVRIDSKRVAESHLISHVLTLELLLPKPDDLLFSNIFDVSTFPDVSRDRL
jgi:hypothetical protein